MAHDAADIVDRAIDWHLRQATMDEAEWHTFVAWLEADPAQPKYLVTEIGVGYRLLAE